MTVGGYRTGAALARYLPGVVAEGLAPPIGFGASFANAERRAMVERHMRRVNPTWPNVRIRQAVQGAFDSYTRYWIESLRLPSLSARTVEAGMRLTGFSHVTDALERGHGRDPRPAPPRRLGVGRALARRRRPPHHRRRRAARAAGAVRLVRRPAPRRSA